MLHSIAPTPRSPRHDDAPIVTEFRVPATSIPTRRHASRHLFIWQARGSRTYVVDGRVHAVRQGQGIWIPAGAEHSFTTDDGSVALPLFFAHDELATTLHETAIVPVDDGTRGLLARLLQSEDPVVQPPVELRRQFLCRIEATPIAPAALPLPAHPPARTVALAILRDPGDNRLVDEWAAMVHASTRTLERAFRAETGMTLREWRRTCRLEAAAVLLRGPSSVASVARRVGYDDQSSFGRVFRQRFGVTPSAYAASARATLTAPVAPVAPVAEPAVAPVADAARPVEAAGDGSPLALPAAG